MLKSANAVVRRASIPLVLTGLALACSTSGSNGVSASLAPSILFPQGVLDSAVALNLTVYDENNGVAWTRTARSRRA